MAKIIRDAQQEEALASIESMLQDIKTIDRLCELADASYRIQAIHSGKDKLKLVLPASSGVKMNALLLDRKKTLAKEIERLSRTYRIELTEDERNLCV